MPYVFRNKLCRILFGILDSVGNLFFLPFTLSKKPPRVVKDILIIRLDHLGDVVYATALAHNLKKHYRDCRITFLVSSAASGLLLHNPYVDEVMVYDAPWFRRQRQKVFEIYGFIKLARRLRRKRFDLGFDPRGDFRHLLLMFVSGVKYKIGYGLTAGGFFLNKCVDYRKGISSLGHNLDLLSALDIPIANPYPALFSSEEDKQQVRSFLGSHNLKEDDFVVVLHLKSPNPSKNWQEERWLKLLERIGNEYNARMIIIGSGEDNQGIERIIGRSRPAIINAAGKISPSALPLLFGHARIYIGIDSGPSHIAGLCRIPTLILYSGTNAAGEWAPQGENILVIQKEVSCAPCARTDCRDNICMKAISVEDVVLGIKELLSKNRL